MAGIFESLTLQTVALAALLVALVGISALYISSIRYPANIPRLRENEGVTRFRLKTRMAYYTDCKNMFREAYEKYSKHGRTVLIPGLGFRDELIIPNSSLRWLTTQPDRVLSTYDAFIEVDQAKYSIGDHKFVFDPWQGMLVKRDMNAVLENLMVALDDELKFSFDERFGADTQTWKELTLLRTMRLMVAQGSSRFTVGLSLCRNEQYLKDNIIFTDLFVAVAGIMGALPHILRPIIGPLIRLPVQYRLRKIRAAFAPLFRTRMALLSSPKSEDPQDHLQMMLRCAETDHKTELNLDDMTGRLVMANFGSFHQTSIAITNVIFNILESDKEYNTIALLREEARAVLEKSGGVWSKAAVSQMVCADSVCRESLRINSFGNRSLIRKVMVDDLRTEDGILLPKGALVSILAHPAQCDGDIFSDPLKFDPFRFSRMRQQSSSIPHSIGAAESEDTKISANGANLALVSTGPQNLPFGHGRHACPGRFLLDFELKMILAYLFTNYDVELVRKYEGQKLQAEWMAEAMMPPTAGKIRVKRRVPSS